MLLCKRTPRFAGSGTCRRITGRRALCVARARAQGAKRNDLGTGIRDDQAAGSLPARDDLAKMPKVDVDAPAERSSKAKREAVDRLLSDMVEEATALGPATPDTSEAAPADGKPRRARRSSRTATASSDPLADAAAAAALAPAAAPAPAQQADGEQPAPRKRRTSRRVSATIDEAPAAAAVAAAAAAAAPEAKRGRRTSRKSAVIDAEPAPAADSAAASTDAGPKQRARRSSRKSAAMDPAGDAAPAAPRQRSRGRSTTVMAADGTEVAMSESALGKQTKAWLQQALAERGAYDPMVHTTKAALVAALLDTAAKAAEPAAAAAAAAGAGRFVGEEEVGLDEAPQEIVSAFGGSYEEVVHQLRGAAGLEDEPAIEPGSGALGGAAAGMLLAADELLRAGAEGESEDEARGGAAAAAAEAEASLGALGSAGAEAAAEAAEYVKPFVTDVVDVPHLPAAAAASPAASPDIPDIKAALFDGGEAGAGDTSPEDEAEDAALGVFDHAGIEFDQAVDAFDRESEAAGDAGEAAAASAALAAAAAPGLPDIAAALAEAPAGAGGALAQDEAPDAALRAFDHMAIDLDLQRASAEQAAHAAPAAAEAAPAAGAAAALAAAAPLVLQDEAPDAALRAFDHMAIDLDLQRVSAEQAAHAAPVAGDAGAAAALAASAPLVLQDEEPDAALGAFDHAATFDWAPPVHAALEAEAVPVAAAAGAALPQKERAAAGDDVMVQFRQWLQQVAAMFEEWQRSLSSRK